MQWTELDYTDLPEVNKLQRERDEAVALLRQMAGFIDVTSRKNTERVEESVRAFFDRIDK